MLVDWTLTIGCKLSNYGDGYSRGLKPIANELNLIGLGSSDQSGG